MGFGCGTNADRTLCHAGYAIFPVRIKLSNSMPVNGSPIEVGEVVINIDPYI